jgi:hypothetical protein
VNAGQNINKDAVQKAVAARRAGGLVAREGQRAVINRPAGNTIINNKNGRRMRTRWVIVKCRGWCLFLGRPPPAVMMTA